MSAQPEQWGARFSERFTDPSVIAAYIHRPPYPDAVIETLIGLMRDAPRAVLDVGCGPGNLARRLAPHAARVDAVDVSPGMIALGTTLPGGDDPRLHWHVGTAETVALRPPYALVTAGASLHWMDWAVALPRFAGALTPNGVLAVAEVHTAPAPWGDALRASIARHSLNQGYRPIDLNDELVSRGLFVKQGEMETEPMPFAQSVDDFIEALHSASSLSRDVMTPASVTDFDAEVRTVLAPNVRDGKIAMGVIATIFWGKPLRKQ